MITKYIFIFEWVLLYLKFLHVNKLTFTFLEYELSLELLISNWEYGLLKANAIPEETRIEQESNRLLHR
jgi:hypothetical protein